MSVTDGFTEIEKLAFKWWRNRRPLEWSLTKHIENPTVNLPTEVEQNLALAIAEQLKAKGYK